MGQEEQGMGGAANMPPFGRESMRRDEEDFEAEYEDEEPRYRSRRRRPHGPRERIHQGMRDMADQLQMAAERLDELADERLADAPGPLARAGEVARGVADRMDSVAEYLRNNEVEDVRRGLERRVREKPFQSILVAVAAGWLVGKVLR